MATATQRTTQSSYGAMNNASNDFDQYINYATVYVGHPPNDEDSNGYVARFRFPSIAFASVISDLRLYLYFKDGWTASTRVYVSSNANLTPYQVVNGSATLLGAKGVSPADGGALTTDKWYVMSLTDYGDTMPASGSFRRTLLLSLSMCTSEIRRVGRKGCAAIPCMSLFMTGPTLKWQRSLSKSA